MRTIIELVLVALVVVAVILVLLRRRKGDEIHSIDRYRDALGTLSDMRGSEGRSYVKVLSPEEQRTARQPGVGEVRQNLRVPSVPLPKPQGDMVFDDGAEAIAASKLAHSRHHDEPEWALDRMATGPRLQNRQLLAALIAVGILALLVVVGVLIGEQPSHHHPSASTTTSTTSKPHTTTTTTLATLPAASQTANGATYNVPGATALTATVSVTTQCWTIATSGSANTQVYAGVVTPGQPVSVNGTSTLSISVAAPSNVIIVVNGLRVVMPSHLTIPTVLTFKATTPVSTTTSSTSTTTTTQVP